MRTDGVQVSYRVLEPEATAQQLVGGITDRANANANPNPDDTGASGAGAGRNGNARALNIVQTKQVRSN